MKFLILYMVFRRSTRNQNPTSLDESATSRPYVTHTSVNRNYETTLEFTRSFLSMARSSAVYLVADFDCFSRHRSTMICADFELG